MRELTDSMDAEKNACVCPCRSEYVHPHARLSHIADDEIQISMFSLTHRLSCVDLNARIKSHFEFSIRATARWAGNRLINCHFYILNRRINHQFIIFGTPICARLTIT